MGKIIGVVAFSFAMGRAVFFGDVFCGGIALMAVLLAVDSIYIYLIPVLWLAMASWGQYTVVWGDFWALVLVALVITFVGKKSLTFTHRIIIAVCAFIGCNCGYLIVAGKTYMLDWLQLAKGIGILVLITLILENIAGGYFRGKKSTRISSVVSAMLITIAAIGIDKVTLIGAICILAVVAIYENMEDLGEAAILTGIILYGTSDGRIGLATIGLVIVGCVCFGTIMNRASVLAMGSRWALAFRTKLRLWLDGFNDRLGVCSREIPAKELISITGVLEEARDNYNILSKMYRDMAGNRQILSFQLQGMERILSSTIEQLKEKGSLRGDSVAQVSRKGHMEFGCESYGGRGLSGDTYVYRTFKGNNTLMLLSDGMGKGEAAAKESKIVAKTIEKIIECGIDADLALKTVNTTLLGYNGDNFATVDMALIDHEKGKCHLYKMGASITFLKRGEKVYSIARSSLPAGLKEKVDIDKITFNVKEGDVLVMITDGIVDCDHRDEEGNWVKSRLEAISSKDPEVICRLIMNKCIEKYGIKERDDLTVLCGYVV